MFCQFLTFNSLKNWRIGIIVIIQTCVFYRIRWILKYIFFCSVISYRCCIIDGTMIFSYTYNTVGIGTHLYRSLYTQYIYMCDFFVLAFMNSAQFSLCNSSNWMNGAHQQQTAECSQLPFDVYTQRYRCIQSSKIGRAQKILNRKSIGT